MTDPDDPSDPSFVIYFIITSISIIANILVVWSLYKLRRASCFTYLLSYLHSTSVLEQIMTIPYLYKDSFTVCRIVQSFQCYFGLMNILTVAVLVEAHLSTIFEDPYDLKTKIVKYGKYIFLLVPCIVFLGFANNTFTYPHSAFCTVPSALTSLTFLFFYYVEIWLALLYSSIRMIYSFIRLYRIDPLLASKYFSSIGWYIIVAILGWLPRSIIRFTNPYAEDDDDNNDDSKAANSLFLGAFYPLIISGLFFAYIYFRERVAIQAFAESARHDSAINDSKDKFSWDEVFNNEDMKSMSSISTNREEASTILQFFGVFRESNRHLSASKDAVELRASTKSDIMMHHSPVQSVSKSIFPISFPSRSRQQQTSSVTESNSRPVSAVIEPVNPLHKETTNNNVTNNNRNSSSVADNTGSSNSPPSVELSSSPTTTTIHDKSEVE